MILKLVAKEIGYYEWNSYSSGGKVTHKMPILTLGLDDSTGETKVTGYLSPFRGYSFQVSASFEGSMDLGSSAVVGLANVKIRDLGKQTVTASTASNCSIPSITKEILKGLALDAITDFCEYPHARYIADGEDDEITVTSIKSFKRSDLYKDYINQVYTYLYGNAEEE